MISLFSTVSLAAMNDAENNFTCLICHQNMIPQNQDDIQIFTQDWAEHQDLLGQLNDLDAILQSNPDLKNYLSSWSNEIFSEQQYLGAQDLIQRKMKRPDVDKIVEGFIVDKLECHAAEVPQLHRACLRKVIEQNKPCPICKQSFSEQDLKKNGSVYRKSGSKKIGSYLAVAIFLSFLFLARSEVNAFLASVPFAVLFKLACVVAVPLSLAMLVQPRGTRLYQVEAFFDGEEIDTELYQETSFIDDTEMDEVDI